MYQEFVVCNVAGNCINERGELNNVLLQVGKIPNPAIAVIIFINPIFLTIVID